MSITPNNIVFTVQTGAPNLPIKPVKKNRRKTTHIIVSIILAALTLITTLSVTSAQQTKTAHANWFTDGLKNFFCGEDYYFSNPEPWQNGLTALISTNPVGSAVTSNVGAASTADRDFLNQRRSLYEIYGMSGTNWTVYRGEKNPNPKEEKPWRVWNMDSAGTIKGEVGPLDHRRKMYDDGCVPFFPVANTFVANNISSVTKFVVSINSWIMSATYEPEWLEGINNKTATIIQGKDGNGGLKDTLYFPMLGIVLMFAAISLLIKAIRNEGSEFWSSLLWVVSATVAGAMFVNNPALIPNMSNAIVNEVSGAVLLGAATTLDDEETGNSINVCYSETDRSFDGNGNSISTNDQRKKALLGSTQCALWETFILTPWVNGQWGTSLANPQLNDATFGGHYRQPPQAPLDPRPGAKGAPWVHLGGGVWKENWALYQLDTQVLDRSTLGHSGSIVGRVAKDQQFGQVIDAVLAPATGEGVTSLWGDTAAHVEKTYGSNAFHPGGDTSYQGIWTASDAGFGRIAIAIAALFSSLISGVLITVLGFANLSYAIGQSILMFFAVLILLIGIHPGFGRRMAKQWASLVVSTAIKRIMTASLLAVTLAFYKAILQDTSVTDWGSSVLAVLAVTIAVFLFRKPILDMASVSFGENGDELTTRGRKGTQALIGGAVGAVAAAGVVKTTMNREDKSTLQNIGKAAYLGATTIASGAASGKTAQHTLGALGKGHLGASMAASMHAGRIQNEIMQSQRLAEQAKKTQDAERMQQYKDLSPNEHAKLAAANKRRNTRYAQDWNEHKDDPEWQQKMRDTYGFEPLDPALYNFDGYGLHPDELKDGQGFTEKTLSQLQDENRFTKEELDILASEITPDRRQFLAEQALRETIDPAHAETEWDNVTDEEWEKFNDRLDHLTYQEHVMNSKNSAALARYRQQQSSSPENVTPPAQTSTPNPSVLPTPPTRTPVQERTFTPETRAAEKQARDERRLQENMRKDQTAEGIAARNRAAAANQRKYERHYRDNANNPEWRDQFTKQYNFPPPDPSQWDFPGYGASEAALKRNPDWAKPQPKNPKEDNGGGMPRPNGR